MKEMKQYDRKSEEFVKVANGMSDIGAFLLSRMSLQACQSLLEKSKESVRPVDLLPFLDPAEYFFELINGMLNIHDGLCTREEGFANLLELIQRGARQALTQFLMNRKMSEVK
jgi:hypothetical protein